MSPMRKLVCASLLLVLGGSAFAGENSYSHTGTARFSSAPRARSIPAPSAWTPPERIKSAPVTMVRRDQPKRIGGGGFSSPAFSSPSFSSPGFSNPSFSNPGFSNPGFSNPGFSNPGFSSPGFSNPGTSNPGFSNPSFSSPSFSN